MVKMADHVREADPAEGQPKIKKPRLDGAGDGQDEADDDAAAGDLSGAVEELPKEISEALDELDSCQRDIDKLNEKASEEILTVEQKFNRLRAPMYSKRSVVIAKIPQFWLTAFSNHPQLSPMIDEEEEKCLQYLRDMVVEENDDIKSGYKIKFLFDENPYFENLELVKDIHLPYGLTDPTVPYEKPKAISTEIKWKKGMDLIKIKEKKPRRRGRFGEDPVAFLEWFTQNGDPTADEVAEILKDDIWPNPMQYYLAPDVEENGMEDDDDDDEDGGLDEDSEQDDAVVVVEEEEDEEEVQGDDGEDDVEEEEDGGAVDQADAEEGDEDEEP